MLEKFFYPKKCFGLNGKIITVYKFRTMVPDADKQLEFIINNFELDSFGKVVNDPRITFLGAFLRKY